MYRESFAPGRSYAPEYLETEDYENIYGDEMYDYDEDYEMSEAVSAEIYEWAEALTEATEDMDDDELAEFAEELMQDEFWGTVLRVAAPIAARLGKKVIRGAGRLISRRGPRVARAAGRLISRGGRAVQRYGPGVARTVGRGMSRYGRPRPVYRTRCRRVRVR